MNRNGYGLAALWLGIASATTWLTTGALWTGNLTLLSLTFPTILTAPLWLLGLIFGIVALSRRDKPRKAAAWGLVLSVVGLPMFFLGGFVSALLFGV